MPGKFAVVAGVLVIAVLGVEFVGATAASGRSSPVEVPYSSLTRERDLETFMVVTATRRQVAAVRSAIERSPRVARFAFLDHNDAYKEAKRIFRRHPGRIRGAKPSDMPESFRVKLRNPGMAFILSANLEHLRGVDSVVSRTLDRRWAKCSTPSDLEVFMNVGATADQIAAVEATVRGDASVARVESISAQQALTMYRCLTEGDRSAVELTADDLPASFRVTMAPSEDPVALRGRFMTLPGVDSVSPTLSQK
jgi:cell division protein FtsX